MRAAPLGLGLVSKTIFFLSFFFSFSFVGNKTNITQPAGGLLLSIELGVAIHSSVVLYDYYTGTVMSSLPLLPGARE